MTVGTTDMPGPEFDVGALIERDLDRHALHHLHIIAGGVFRRQQAERGAAAGLDAVDVAGEGPAERVDLDVDGLSDLHVGELQLLEIGGDPDIERHDDHDRLPGRGQRADGGGQFGDAAVDGGAQFGSLQIGIGAILLRLGLIELRRGADLLRVEHVDLPFGRHLGRGRRVERGLLAVEVG